MMVDLSKLFDSEGESIKIACELDLSGVVRFAGKNHRERGKPCRNRQIELRGRLHP